MPANTELSAAEISMFRALEEDLWRAETRFDRELMSEVFADDFLEFGGSGGVYDRDAILASSGQTIDAELPLPDFEARRIAEGVVLVTYNSIVHISGDVQHRRRSSIWTEGENGWVIRFHQGTPYSP